MFNVCNNCSKVKVETLQFLKPGFLSVEIISSNFEKKKNTKALINNDCLDR